MGERGRAFRVPAAVRVGSADSGTRWLPLTVRTAGRRDHEPFGSFRPPGCHDGVVQVRSDRRYRFNVGPEVLWPVLTRVEDYRSWWPWLRRFDATTFEPGAAWTCVVQPPLPYSLRFRIVLDEIDPCRSATARVDGDIVGDARLELTPTDEGTEVRLRSSLAPENQLLRAIARVARPVAQLGHDWVLDTGLRQFRSRALP
jgi:uncharacterized protein YndB with AHSA1/START domain